MKLWIARDKDGGLFLFSNKPYFENRSREFLYEEDDGDYATELPIDAFPEVTFENSPQEVELKLISK